MSDPLRIVVVFGMIILINLIGHVFPPNSILASPVVIAISAVLLLGSKLRVSVRIGLFCLIVVMNDLLLKNIAGGIHDIQGAGWINTMMIIGVFISMIIGLVVFLSEKLPVRVIIVALLSIGLFSTLYVNYFAFHGLKTNSYHSDTLPEAKKEGNFVRAIFALNDSVTNEQDTIVLLSGWMEREIGTNHKGLIQRSEPTGYLLGTIETHNTSSGTHRDDITYKINSTDVNGSSPVFDFIRFRVLEDDSVVNLTFFDVKGLVKEWRVIKTVTVPLSGKDTFE